MKAIAQIFLCYARQDEKKVENLYQKLSDVGFKPWMDKKDILPGERWQSSIEKAIRSSDFFLACLSANSVNKRGFLQKEIKDALDIWREKLVSDIYLIPARLEDCEVPESLRGFQWVNLFEEDGWTRSMKAIQVGMERRAEVIKPSVQESTPFEPHPTREKPIPSAEKVTPQEDHERVQQKERENNASKAYSQPKGGSETKAIRYGLGILGTIGLAVFTTLFSSNKTTAIWTLFSTIVVYTLAFCLYWQQQVWKEEAAHKKTTIWTSFSIIVISSLALCLYWQQQAVPKLEQPTFREKVEKATFSLGEGGFHVTYEVSDLEKEPKEPFDLDGFKPVRMYVEDGKLYADVKVYGGAGRPPIEIKHNEFVVRPPNWDRNSSETALEVVNESQFPVFQFIYKTPFHIVVNGIFPSPVGLILANESGITVVRKSTLPQTFFLKRIFKYPSWKYPGQHE